MILVVPSGNLKEFIPIKQIDDYKKGNMIAMEDASEVFEIPQDEPLEDDAAVQ